MTVRIVLTIDSIDDSQLAERLGPAEEGETLWARIVSEVTSNLDDIGVTASAYTERVEELTITRPPRWRTARRVYIYAITGVWTIQPIRTTLSPLEWFTLNHIARMASSNEVEHAYWPLIEAAG